MTKTVLLSLSILLLTTVAASAAILPRAGYYTQNTKQGNGYTKFGINLNKAGYLTATAYALKSSCGHDVGGALVIKRPKVKNDKLHYVNTLLTRVTTLDLTFNGKIATGTFTKYNSLYPKGACNPRVTKLRLTYSHKPLVIR